MHAHSNCQGIPCMLTAMLGPPMHTHSNCQSFSCMLTAIVRSLMHAHRKNWATNACSQGIPEVLMQMLNWLLHATALCQFHLASSLVYGGHPHMPSLPSCLCDSVEPYASSETYKEGVLLRGNLRLSNAHNDQGCKETAGSYTSGTTTSEESLQSGILL
jgi:hypothetical protein